MGNRHVFRHPEQSPIWIVVNQYCKQVAQLGFLPLFSMLITPFDCTKQSNGTLTLDYEPSRECFKGSHIAEAILSLVALVLLVAFSVRIMLVYGELQNLETEGRWLWDWAGDLRVNPPRKHPLSFRAPNEWQNKNAAPGWVPAPILRGISYLVGGSVGGPYYEVQLVAVKALMSGVTLMFATEHKVAVSVTLLVLSVAMLAMVVVHWPYVDVFANRAQTSLQVGVLWTYVISLWVVGRGTGGVGQTIFFILGMVLGLVCGYYGVEVCEKLSLMSTLRTGATVHPEQCELDPTKEEAGKGGGETVAGG